MPDDHRIFEAVRVMFVARCPNRFIIDYCFIDQRASLCCGTLHRLEKQPSLHNKYAAGDRRLLTRTIWAGGCVDVPRNAA